MGGQPTALTAANECPLHGAATQNLAIHTDRLCSGHGVLTCERGKQESAPEKEVRQGGSRSEDSLLASRVEGGAES